MIKESYEGRSKSSRPDPVLFRIKLKYRVVFASYSSIVHFSGRRLFAFDMEKNGSYKV